MWRPAKTLNIIYVNINNSNCHERVSNIRVYCDNMQRPLQAPRKPPKDLEPESGLPGVYYSGLKKRAIDHESVTSFNLD